MELVVLHIDGGSDLCGAANVFQGGDLEGCEGCA